jgi:two-component system NtrC family sensor kinase
MLRTKLFRGFALLVVLMTALTLLIGVPSSQRRVLAEAQTRVRLDLGSAWAVVNAELRQIETILRLVGSKQIVLDISAAGNWDDAEMLHRLDRVRAAFNLDFLDLVSPEGEVKVRVAPPHRIGDSRATDPLVAAALRGRIATGTIVLSREDMEREAETMADRAFLQLEETPRARATPRSVESRGMVMASAVPVMKGSQLIAVVYGGMLLNRNHDLVDRIQDVVFKNETYKNVQVGTVTVFLGDTRVATTVHMANGNRALGTRVSKEVADRVLDNGAPWIGEAFVVKDRYLTAYEPIRNYDGAIVGMLYVGTLKKPFEDYARSITKQYVYCSLLALLAGLGLAFLIANRLAAPIHRLVEASVRLTHGEHPPPLDSKGGCEETQRLIQTFNQMATTLGEREGRLKALNRNYMETLGFVSHELKSPVASIMNYVYLLREQKLGPLNEKQLKAVRAMDQGSERLVEMVRHYLNLARIENGELEPVRGRVAVAEEILAPVLETIDADLRTRRMTLTNDISADTILHADRNMTREVFENLLSNALKYGREGGLIKLGATDEGAMVAFTVYNEGAGIAPERIPELFQKFSRIEGSDGARRQRGTGLGLFITKHIVEAHGGRIEARSEQGEWVEFTFTLPRLTGGNEDAKA